MLLGKSACEVLGFIIHISNGFLKKLNYPNYLSAIMRIMCLPVSSLIFRVNYVSIFTHSRSLK